MQSLRHASSLRPSIIASALFAVLTSRPGSADTPPEDAPAPAPIERPLSPQELDPTRAFSDRIILLVRTQGDEGVMTRLYADLRQSDWRIVEIRAEERLEPPPLGASALREGASAAVRVDVRRGVIVLWVERPEGPVEETIGGAGEPLDEQVLALRGSEALRARGLLVAAPVLRDEGRPPALPVSPSPRPVSDDSVEPTPTQRASDEPPRLWLALGPGVTLGPGGLGPLPLADVGTNLSFAGRWSAGLRGLLPLSSQSLSADEGEADVATWFALALVELEWARFGFSGLRSGLGGGAAFTTMSGKTEEAGFDAASDTVVTFAPLVSSSFHAGLGQWFRVRSSVALGATIPEVRVSFGSREVASFGRPFFVASVTLESSPAGW